MGKRLELHQKLVELLGTQNEPLDKQRVYFQPPSAARMSYPCIVYKRDAQSEARADNLLYHAMKRYLVTIIDTDPDSKIPDKMMDFRYCTFVTHFAADNLNHDVYSLYY